MKYKKDTIHANPSELCVTCYHDFSFLATFAGFPMHELEKLEPCSPLKCYI